MDIGIPSCISSFQNIVEIYHGFGAFGTWSGAGFAKRLYEFTVHSSGTNSVTFRRLCCKKLLLDFKKNVDSCIRLNELYRTVEKHLQKNF
jgi:hypothetical protein